MRGLGHVGVVGIDDSPTSAPQFRTLAILLTIVLLGFALRLEWTITQAVVISSDGSEYATMAEHLRNQHALVGMYEGPEILYAPLYSILIAIAMLVFPNSEMAAHLVSLLTGTALIAIVFLVARRMYGPWTALISAALVAVHPMLVALSASVYNEALYLTVWTAMAYCGLRALELQRRRDAVALGIGAGLTYLTRVDGAAYLAFIAAALVAVGLLKKQARVAALHLLIVCTVFILMALPYLSFFYRHTGKVRFEAKWDINYTMARNRLAGMNGIEADYGVGHDATVEGPLLEPFSFVDFTPYAHSFADQLRSVAAMAKRNARTVYYYVLEPQIGPIVLGLLVVGWCRRCWDNRRLRDETLLMGLVSLVLIVTVTSATAERRYLSPIMPVLMLWSSNGLLELAKWIMGWEVIRILRGFRPALVSAAVSICVAAVIVALSLNAVHRDWFTAEPDALAARDAGLWLAQQQPESPRIAVRLPVCAYYAKGTMIAFPYGDPEATLRHLARKNVDFIVLQNAEAQVLPTIGEWLAHGIPDPRARLIYDKRGPSGARVVIYTWSK